MSEKNEWKDWDGSVLPEVTVKVDETGWTDVVSDPGDKLTLAGTDAKPDVFIGTFLGADMAHRTDRATGRPETDENGAVLEFPRILLMDRTGTKCWMWQNSRIKEALENELLVPGCTVRVVSYGKRDNPKTGMPFHRMEIQVKPVVSTTSA